MNSGKSSIVPFLIAIIAVVVLVFGLRTLVDRVDSNADAQDAVSEEQTEVIVFDTEEASVEETATESEEATVSSEEPSSEEISSEEASVEESEKAAETPVEEAAEAVSETASEEPVQATSGLRFRSKKLLNDHYNKHGIDMGFGSAKEYEAAAAAVVANPNALHKTEKEDGDDVYYVEATNEFVVVSTDGYIRTYFCPDSGIKYYNKQ